MMRYLLLQVDSADEFAEFLAAQIENAGNSLALRSEFRRLLDQIIAKTSVRLPLEGVSAL